MGKEEVKPTLCVPGFGLKVDERVWGTFPSAVGRWFSIGVTLREKRMMAFINDITDKPDWERKVFDDNIVERWRAEGDVRPESLGGDVVLSQKMFDFCIQELRDKAALFKENGLVNIFDADLTIVKSDTVVSGLIRDALITGVTALEDVPEHLKDWHPRSNNMVLDLVHPSLFPVTYGLTKVLPDEKVPLDGCLAYIGKGTTIDPFTPLCPRPTDNINLPASMFSFGSFQWLPTDIELSDSGAKILGYINNLHPEKHRGLYGVLEKIVAAAVPLWEEALNHSKEGRFRIGIRNLGTSEDWTYPEGLKYRVPGAEEGPKAYYDPIKEVLGDELDSEDDFDWHNEDEYYDWVNEHRILRYPEPRNYKSQAELKEGSRIRLREKPSGLQVIFKLANIHLTPEKPTYEGGSWHVEGCLNEQICASAIYYFDQENITDSHLAFRQSLDSHELLMLPEQDQYESLATFLGIEQHGPAVQSLGQVLTRQGRLIAFPNFVQHQVQSFSLQDKTKPGYRKILAMFLIDPARRVLSTSNVPPQRRDWWAEELRANDVLERRLPAELVDHTIGLVDDFPISWETAVEMREKLMDERGADTFSFCEH
ncbi:uncharacterized protein DNG_06365 [Cephalotrichum gorgonifer]|uniref:Uncharacterized protein n=1 Tax=Cephalotrichum gorgonifer TaxID=2041049 RepID=A0AAE8MZV7_9PEZI|nr:uncharacterized protein DNG_06365 [Cephalotrichum gorgonifer]